MRYRSDVPIKLPRDIGDADVALIVPRLVSKAMGDAESAVEGISHGGTERSAGHRFPSIGDRRMRDEGGDVGHHILPDLIDICLNVIHTSSAHGHSLHEDVQSRPLCPINRMGQSP